MARKRKSDDMNVVAPHINEILTRSGHSSLISDHYQKILIKRKSIQEFAVKLFGNDEI